MWCSSHASRIQTNIEFKLTLTRLQAARSIGWNNAAEVSEEEVPMSSQRLMLGLAIVHVVAALAWAEPGIVKVTPLGSQTGNFCAQDRALLFEDPTGVRILYDPGNTLGAARTAGSARLMPSSSVMPTAITSGI
jgi:hypothetical protein